MQLKTKGKEEKNVLLDEKQKEKTLKRGLKTKKGITLIALVITIIVLLILAGVSIAMLTGENGILNKATTAKQKTEQGTAEERVKLEVAGSLGENGKLETDLLNENLRKNINGLTYNGKAITEKGVAEENRIDSFPATVELDGYEIIINENGSASTIIRMAEYQTEDTKPYLPGNDFSQVSGTTLDNGLVVTDGTNYWTWVEVPKTAVFKTATSETDYTNIEKDMETYTTTGQFDDEGALNLDREGYTDQWYDYCGASYDGSSPYSQVRFPNATEFNEAKEYYGAIYSDSTGTTPVESFGNSRYYVRIDNKLDDNRGCGLTYSEYNNLKETMLSSVYKNGGFWIGQYEAGADTYPAKEDNSRTLIIAQGKYPYNYITCANAQIKSSELNSGDYTSSLMFGIQWDLVLKHLQVRGGMSLADLKHDSTNWGNYPNATFTIENGQYTTNVYEANSFKPYTEATSGCVEENIKLKNKSVLLTTGANASQNSKMNIYDIVGNVFEWTLEKSHYDPYNSCTTRGGGFGTYNYGNIFPASYRGGNIINYSSIVHSFRPALY